MAVAELEVQDVSVSHLPDVPLPLEYWGAWFVPLDGDSMNKINLIAFYQFGKHIESSSHVKAGEPAVETWRKLFDVQQWLLTFRMEARDVPMVNAKRSAQRLMEHISPIYERTFSALREADLAAHEKALITLDESLRFGTLLREFEQDLEHDSREINIFSVADVGTHSTTKLLDEAHLNLSADVRSRLSDEVINDLNAAGRCLAFNTPTAAAFHILRAVEPLILGYHNVVTGTALPLRSRSWGTYIDRLTRRGGDVKIIGMIRHIKDFYRNPIMHPEETLSTEQALALFYTCLSAIVQLDAAIQALSAGSAPAASPPSAPTP